MSKTKQTEGTSWSGRCYYQGGGPCDARSRTCVGTTDVSLPVKKQHRQNELAGQVDIPTRVEVPVMPHKGSHFSGLTKFPDFSLTFPVFFAIFQYFFNVLFF